jgi:hypothetical protein
VERRVTMKRVLVFMLGAVMIVSLSLVVSCQKKEETGVSEEKAAGYGKPAAGYGEQAVEHLEKAAGYGEQAVKEAAEKAAGH